MSDGNERDIVGALRRAADQIEWGNLEPPTLADARVLRELASVLDGNIYVHGVNLRDAVRRALDVDWDGVPPVAAPLEEVS